MKIVCSARPSLFSLTKGALALASVALLANAQAVSIPTDISSIPLVVSGSAQVKPNIMLLMDNSGSMARTHMPDEAESVMGVLSVGYKSPQCNSLYFSPESKYILPRKQDGVNFPVPSFNAAPNFGYGAFFATPDLTVTNLGTEFVPYSRGRREVLGPVAAPTAGPSQGYNFATPGPAYYYWYTGPETSLKYDAPPCNQLDTGVSAPTPGGGNWERKIVTPDQQRVFAIWYSFYRTRLAMTKSAASLAFSSLDASQRVGFVTVEPKINRLDAMISADRYLSIGDFTPGALGQKDEWYKKVFSQESTTGSSPAREGLARVGRYYANKRDSINRGMVGPDPIQYACQQNFTILTTDGYWNAQTESPFGGGVQLDGTTLVGQQDGDPDCPVTNPYCARPMYDGNSADIRYVTDANNAYRQENCPRVDSIKQDVWQQQRKVFNLSRNTNRTVKRTIQYRESSTQLFAHSERTVRTVTQTEQKEEQYWLDTPSTVKERYQVWKWQDKIVYSTEQFQKQRQQQTKQTVRNIKKETQTMELDEQWQTASTRFGIKTVRFEVSTTLYQEGKKQIKMRKWQRTAKIGSEAAVPIAPGDPCPDGAVCTDVPIMSLRLVHPGTSCLPAVTPFNAANPDLSYVQTQCTNGDQASDYQPVRACSPSITPGVTRPATTPDWVEIRCDEVSPAPAYSDGFTAATCRPFDQAIGSPYKITRCRLVEEGPVWQALSCTANDPVPSGSGNTYKTTQCIAPPENNYLARNSAPCTVAAPAMNMAGITLTCTKRPDVDRPAPPAGPGGCVDQSGTSEPYMKVRCYSKPSTDTPTPIGLCTVLPPSFPDYTRTECIQTGVGPFSAALPVPFESCASGPFGDPYEYDTVCKYPDATNTTQFVAATDCPGGVLNTPATVNPWINVICRKVSDAGNLTAAPWDSRSGACTDNPGTFPPFIRVTCGAPTLVGDAERPVDENTCTSPVSHNGNSPFVTTHCEKRPLPPTFDCASPTAAGPNDWIYEKCSDGPTSTVKVGYESCVLSATCRKETTSKYVVSCTPGPVVPLNSDPKVTCPDPTVWSGAVNPAVCPILQGPQGGLNQYDIRCVLSDYGDYAVRRAVEVCPVSLGLDPISKVVTTCDSNNANSFAPRDAAPCTEPGVAGTELNGWIKKTCVKTDVSEFIRGSLCADVAQVLTGPSVTCTTGAGQTREPVDSCTVGNSDGSTPFDTVTACPSDENEAPWNGYGPALCVRGNGLSVGQRIDCRTEAVSTTTNPNCSGTAVPDSSGFFTTCTPIDGSGYKYKRSTTTTRTRTPMSGGVAAGVSVSEFVAGSPTPWVDANNVCYADVQSYPSATFPAKPNVTIGGCAAWPCTVDVSSPGGSVNSLADVAQYYYKNDLRSDFDNVVRSTEGADPQDDTAKHQHMTTFVVALGVNGTLEYTPNYRTAVTGDFFDIRRGVKEWPVWPDPIVDYTDLSKWENPKSIDDFWHAAVNGHGLFFSARNPRSVIYGLEEALAKAKALSAAGAADAISSLTPTAVNNFVYGTSYESVRWVGDLEAFTINPVTGILNPRVWSAADFLEAKTAEACDSRKVYLMRGNSPMVDFAWNTTNCAGVAIPGVLTAAEKANFSPAKVGDLSQFVIVPEDDPQRVAANAPGLLVNYLRGQRGKEGYLPGDVDKLFRTRAKVLGDLVNSQPVYVKQPFADYAGDYQVFKNDNRDRTPMVYVGGNDGMLHAFYASVDNTDPLRGQEAWAVIPSTVLPDLYRLADRSYDRVHRYFVDGTPVASDVYDGAWHTILVGGLNAGGKGYYALDITNPATPVALWEFKYDNGVCTAPAPAAVPAGTRSDCNLGLSFGKPVITKLGARWVVMLTSGHNNLNGAARDGEGFLYVLDAMTGELIHKIGTGAGDGVIPSGLAQINNYVDNVLINNATLRAYGGDLLGNIWRFDFTPPKATLVGTAKSLANDAQPITTRPELAELNGEPFVLVGTGKLLGDTDVSNTRVQSVYGIRDKLTTVPSGTPPAIYPSLRGSLRGMRMTQVGIGATAVRTVACTTNCALTNGWVVDLAEAGERVNVDMKLVLGTLVFASNVPSEVPCSIGGHSWFNQLDFRTGTAVTTAPLSGPDGIISNYLADSLNQGFNVIRRDRAPGDNNPGDFQANARQGDGKRFSPKTHVATPDFIGKRISWREVVQ